MRRLWAALMITALLLGGCAKQDRLEARLDKARAEIAAAENLSFLANVSVELADSVFDCVLRVERSEDETVIEVVEPEIIAGIRARLRQGETLIEYEDMMLSIGDAISGELSPIAAMPLVLDALGAGHVSMVWEEQQGEISLIAAQSYVSDNEYMKIWFEAENFTPVQAELVSGGKVVVKCRIEEFKTGS